jgi:hypothetical protein
MATRKETSFRKGTNMPKDPGFNIVNRFKALNRAEAKAKVTAAAVAREKKKIADMKKKAAAAKKKK